MKISASDTFCALAPGVQTNRPTATERERERETGIFEPLANALKKSCIEKPLKK
jgi:hypothetical protein